MMTTAKDLRAARSPMAGYTQKTAPRSAPEAPARAAPKAKVNM